MALCDGNPPVTDGFSWQRVSTEELVSIHWRQQVLTVSDESRTVKVDRDTNSTNDSNNSGRHGYVVFATATHSTVK